MGKSGIPVAVVSGFRKPGGSGFRKPGESGFRKPGGSGFRKPSKSGFRKLGGSGFRKPGERLNIRRRSGECCRKTEPNERRV
jgi:hypothetical protein